jgi:probable LLM family oxidoreductase
VAGLEFGLDTAGDLTNDGAGNLLPYAQVLRNVVREAELADEFGIDFFGIGEHHRDDYAVSTPEVVLAAIAARTQHIRLGSTVTVLSADDPIRVFQRFSTLDALSDGRAEITLGRGSFTEAFPLFGFDLAQYEQLFEEKLNLFAAVRQQQPVTWSGRSRMPLTDQLIYPPLEHGLLKTWIGVGGNPESVLRAAKYGFGLMLAIVGGDPVNFSRYTELYQRGLEQFEQPKQPIGVESNGHLAETDEQAREELWPHYVATYGRLASERGWPQASREQFLQATGPEGAFYVGSPESVAVKIARTVKALGLARFNFKYSGGANPHEKLMRSIELYGTAVVPRVRELLS